MTTPRIRTHYLHAVFYRAFLILLTLGALSGCAGKTAKTDEFSEVDPYEDFNRNMYEFNDTVDDYVAAPITDAYKFVTPDLVQTGVSNFFNNLGNVGVVINDVLQGKVKQGAEDTGRFIINSTIGVFGLFDVATDMGLPQNQEDFGQTLAVWGVPSGPYLVMPFLGPTTFRGMPGAAVDVATNPITYLGLPAIHAASIVNTRANAEGSLQFIDEAALDPYIFTREAYLQWRNHLATDGADTGADDALSDYEDELFAEEELYEVDMEIDNIDATNPPNTESPDTSAKLAGPDSEATLTPETPASSVDNPPIATDDASNKKATEIQAPLK